MTKLTRKEFKFEWTEKCQIGFDFLKTCFTMAPILKYPDSLKRYVVFIGASDKAAAAVLTQEYPDEDGEIKEMSVAYLSVQFSGAQFKWSTVVKECYAIYYCARAQLISQCVDTGQLNVPT